MGQLKPIDAIKINRLDQYLRIWEDKWECFEIEEKVHQILGVGEGTYKGQVYALSHWKDLRKLLLSAVTKDFQDQVRMFGDGALISGALQDHLAQDFFFPEAVFNWSKCSRRVFQVDDELAASLANTSFGDVTFADVKLPFEAFAVSLQTPIWNTTKKHKFDFALFARVNVVHGILHNEECKKSDRLEDFVEGTKVRHGENPFCMLFFRSGMESYRKEDAKLKQRILEKIADGDAVELEALARRYKRRDASFKFNSAACMLIDPSHPASADTMLRDLLGGMQSIAGDSQHESHSDYLRVARIIFGLAMYLTTCSESDSTSLVRTPVSPEKRSGYNVITDAAEVLKINFQSELKKDEARLMSESIKSYELSPHFRQGYWRRAPGQRGVADPKLVWVRPTIVRKDKLPAMTLPVSVSMKI